MNKNLILGLVILACFVASGAILYKSLSGPAEPSVPDVSSVSGNLLPFGREFDLSSVESFGKVADPAFVVQPVTAAEAGLLPAEAFRPARTPITSVPTPPSQGQ